MREACKRVVLDNFHRGKAGKLGGGGVRWMSGAIRCGSP
jgi:hypothetical protein